MPIRCARQRRGIQGLAIKRRLAVPAKNVNFSYVACLKGYLVLIDVYYLLINRLMKKIAMLVVKPAFFYRDFGRDARVFCL
jgi:hypothetical protein